MSLLREETIDNIMTLVQPRECVNHTIKTNCGWVKNLLNWTKVGIRTHKMMLMQ